MTQRFEEQPRDLYTIPISSSWFNWDAIHDTERRSLPEFFNHSSYSRNPRVYKEYRDFIINKFREDTSRRLTFTEVRKSLIGDVGSLEKVFRFLDRWGLINFGVKEEEERSSAEVSADVVVEEGAPAGVKVVPAAGSGGSGGGGGGVEGGGFRLPALSSYSDVFGDWMVCGVCGGRCDSERVELVKGSYAMCSKCSENKKNKEEKPADDSKPNNHVDGSDNQVNNAWTDAETLLLLEAVLKHGDDWDLIAQHVRTKSKLDCIARLIHLPFGDHMLGPIHNKLDSNKNSVSELTKEAQNAMKERPEEPSNANGEHLTDTDQEKKDNDNKEIKKVAKESYPDRPTKKRCLPSLTDVTDSLTEQVALLSTIAGSHIAATAAEAAVTALGHENLCAQNAFGIDVGIGLSSKDEMESDLKFEDEDMKRHKQTDIQESSTEKSFGATTFQIRAAIATAFGAAAARAKLFADQEEREMELLMATVIEMQLKKLKIKMKHFEELEVIMEKEYFQIQQHKELILEEWFGILQQATFAGNPQWKDNGLSMLLLNTNL